MGVSDVDGGVLPTDEGTLFRVSSFCTSGGCVEVAPLSDGQVVVRDSKNRAHPVHVYSAKEWREFIAGAKNGEFDFG